MIPAIDLREAVRRDPLVLSGLEHLSTEDLRIAREHWRIHMAAEFASARVFSGLVPQMMDAGLDFSSVREVTDMARQEVDHGLLSARVHAALGGPAHSELPPLARVPEHQGCSPLEIVLRNIISVSCCGETLAVTVIGNERDRATLDPLREILTRILADEIGHSRFGWRLLQDLAPALDEPVRRRLSAYLVNVFERDLAIMRGCAEQPSASEAALALGAPDGPIAWESYWSTLTAVTIPGLERHGLKASWALDKAWERVVPVEAMPALAQVPD